MAWPCTGPRKSVRRTSRSRVPCSSSTRSFCSLVDILGQGRWRQVECQGEWGARGYALQVSPALESLEALRDSLQAGFFAKHFHGFEERRGVFAAADRDADRLKH